jgi:hypothetical protein
VDAGSAEPVGAAQVDRHAHQQQLRRGCRRYITASTIQASARAANLDPSPAVRRPIGSSVFGLALESRQKVVSKTSVFEMPY